MRKIIITKSVLLLLAISFALVVTGCGQIFARFRVQEPEDFANPQQDVDPDLKIPDEIDEGEDVEPGLIVYLDEEDVEKEMPMEEYLMGVVAGEMSNDWHAEALAAQAIIARTFTLQKINESGGVPEKRTHASTDIQEFQAYNAEAINDNVKEAIEKTRGMVISHNGAFIRSWFHAYAGDRTALADEGLDFQEENPPYIQIVDSPGKDIVPEEEGSWEKSFSVDQVKEAISSITGEDPGQIDSMEISEKGSSGRALKIKVNDAEVLATALRTEIGSTEMRSTFLDNLSMENDQVNMSGIGYGHGVGMCQWGARAMAEDGQSAEDIINYFYKDVNIVKLWQ